ncbi:LbetaH domain-containing protein [Virgibacillus dakarensis]|uniref:UDP-3-O-(3-hydroxymyristoyl)glucosamine N-acyltransferase n=1 Tax=Virgibacillus dakarensis TaxID=1917889 RepID=UPI000B43640C|nr:UDP-3-O-(3-hydroxymyristoyl)glucosamine N-acyltransferase [Virgibacillus dakarensis]
MKLSEIEFINGNFQIKSDCEFDALGLATSHYEKKKVLSFLTDIKYLDSVINNKEITGLICTMEIYNNIKATRKFGFMISENPKVAFFNLHNHLVERNFYGEGFDNNISMDTKISKHAIIGDNSIKIGKNTIIEAGVVIHPGSIIGNNVIIRSGSQIGTTGFQFIKDKGKVIPVKSSGRVIIKDNVEVQHNCCIDKGVLGGDTILEKDVKVSNAVNVGHDNVIGERTFITAGVVLGGRVAIGRDCWIGINATVSNGIKIGGNSKVSLGAVVTKNVEANSTVSGNFAINHDKFLRFIKSI